eukprot:TRINITY_DN18_c0_g2_i1.p1 TRINITY_DN18_c0_g2~~TRINITY_DN18_c0_g2_i1.p1  ORF type:complete len:552 (+),score=110.26 TRINITY_DN18_c0_g2_i1:90-1658(+)
MRASTPTLTLPRLSVGLPRLGQMHSPTPLASPAHSPGGLSGGAPSGALRLPSIYSTADQGDPLAKTPGLSGTLASHASGASRAAAQFSATLPAASASSRALPPLESLLHPPPRELEHLPRVLRRVPRRRRLVQFTDIRSLRGRPAASERQTVMPTSPRRGLASASQVAATGAAARSPRPLRRRKSSAAGGDDLPDVELLATDSAHLSPHARRRTYRRKSSNVQPLGPRPLRPDEEARVVQRMKQDAGFNWRDGQLGPLPMSSWGTVYPSPTCGPGVDCPAPHSVGGTATTWVDSELSRFEDHMSFTIGERTYRTGLPRVTAAPPVAIVLFRLMLLKGTRVVESLRKIPRATLMHHFVERGTGSGQMSRCNFHAVLQELCGPNFDTRNADRLFEVFDRDHSGDVDVRELEAGLSVVLDGVAPAESMQFFFGLINQRSRFPRYITKFELQTLIGMFISHRASSASENAAALQAGFDKALEALSFDYCGRASMKDFINSLNSTPEAFRQIVGANAFLEPEPASPD